MTKNKPITFTTQAGKAYCDETNCKLFRKSKGLAAPRCLMDNQPIERNVYWVARCK